MEHVEASDHPGRWWHPVDDGRIQCDLCPRFCRLPEGSRGACFVRQNVGGKMVLTTYGRSSGFCVDPIEKKPFHHYYPGSSVLSFGTAGCNLMCKFCQNWDISKARDFDRLQDQASPEQIAHAARRMGCKSVAFTYNDPVIFAEYGMDVADACHAVGVEAVAVSAGYICAEPRAEFFGKLDAVKIDLKAFTEEFYAKVAIGHLEPVLETIEWLAKESKAWLEVVTLVIPGANDSEGEIRKLAVWMREHVGTRVPLHFSAFHPDYKMMDLPPTPPATLKMARRVSLEEGLQFVYTGNVHDVEGDTTCCPGCGAKLIVRDWYEILQYRLDGNGACPDCGRKLEGRYDAEAGTWGRRRARVELSLEQV